jgi:hypothetical protein
MPRIHPTDLIPGKIYIMIERHMAEVYFLRFMGIEDDDIVGSLFYSTSTGVDTESPYMRRIDNDNYAFYNLVPSNMRKLNIIVPPGSFLPAIVKTAIKEEAWNRRSPLVRHYNTMRKGAHTYRPNNNARRARRTRRHRR